MLKSGMKN